MKILHIGRKFGTTLHRFNALRRLGHDVYFVDPFNFLPSSVWAAKWIYETGAWGFEKIVEQSVLKAVLGHTYDFAFIDGGYVIGPGLVQNLGKQCASVINYNVDDPFSPKEWRKWRLYRESAPFYDLLVVVREQNILEAKSLGAQAVLHVFRSADEVAHRPIAMDKEELSRWASEVAFIGTWMPERGPFMARLLELGIPLSIWGDRWYKAREWPQIKRVWRGNGLYDQDYNKAIQSAKICLGLLSKGNRDLHTQRSLEIPALGGLFCAERTPEHLSLYEDGKEAIFWSDVIECSEQCHRLLNASEERLAIVQNGYQRCVKNNYFNEPILDQILHYLPVRNNN